MSNDNNPRIQELFLAALEMPAEQRDVWLAEQCGDDDQLLREVRALLEHDSPDNDPLEQRLDEAIDVPSTLIPDAAAGGELSERDVTQVDSEHFISKLTEVGVLSQEEIATLNQTVASGQSSANPRQIASHLVSQGKLTDYQATALLKGQPDLLIDKYLILDLLDAGGMGMVFKAIHRPMNRTVAVKMIAQHLLASPEQVKRFQREVRVAATLEHPNIVRSYDADQSRGIHFLVMEYVRGENLTRIVQRQGPMSVEMAVDCIRQAAKGLRYAQKKGVIHRDIKPGNLMLGGEGIVKVLDLGLANIDESFRLAQQSSITGDEDSHTAQSLAGSELTSAGAVLGTVSFMAPEQSLDARKADTRADIYSLGCTLYYLLVGEAPYKGDTIFQVFMLHREGEIPSLRDKRPDVPEQVEAVCHKMLAKRPEDRYQSMGELLTAIEDCDIAPPPETVKPEKSKATNIREIGSTVSYASQEAKTGQQSKSLTPLGWLSAFVLLLALGGGYWWWQNNANQDDAPTQVAGTTADDGETTPVTQPVTVATPQYGLHFDGDGDYVELPSIKDFGTEPFTIEAFVTVQGEAGSSILSAGAAQLEVVSRKTGGLRVRAVLEDRPGDGHWAHWGSTQVDKSKLSSGKRQHLTFIFDGTQARVFIDGKFASNEMKYFSNGNDAPERIKPVSNYPDQPTRIGRFLTDLPRIGPRFFQGTIDEVRISTSVRYTGDFTPADRFEADDETLALYHFDEGEGDVLTDSSGNNHHGKIVGAQWVRLDEQPQFAQVNHALYFDGVDDRVEIPSLKLDGTKPATLEATVRLDSEPTSSNSEMVVIETEGRWIARQLYEYPNEHPTWVAGVTSDANQMRHTENSNQPVVHLALVYDMTTVTLFIDGKKNTRHRHSSVGKGEQPIHPLKSGSGSWLGCAPFHGKKLHGTIDEVRISTSARYTEDFTPADRFEADADTLALYHFDEGEGDVLTDSSGNNHHGKIVGAQWVRLDEQPQLAQEGYALSFDGDDDCVEIPTLKDFGTEPFTIEALVAFHGEQKCSIFSASAAQLEIDWHEKGFPYARPVLSDRFGVGHWAGSEVGKLRLIPVKKQHLAFTFDGNKARAYIDGKFVTNKMSYFATGENAARTDGLISPVSKYPNEPTLIGRYIMDGLNFQQRFFKGTIDEVRISTSARYTEDFKPVDRFEADADTLALYHFDEGEGDVLTDSSGNGHHGKIVGAKWIKVYDEANLSAADLLATGEYEWQVEKMPEPINSPRADIGDFAADLTADALTIVFSSYREEGSYGLSDLWEASRDSIDAPWNEPVNLGHLVNSEKGEYDLTLSDDGLTVIFNRDGRAYMSVRESRTSPWTQAQAFQFPSTWVTPTLTSDEITMCLGVNGRLAMTHRASVDAPWPNPKLLPETLSGNADIARGAISSDGRSLLIERLTPNDSDQSKTRKSSHWLSSRKDADPDWSEPVQIDLGELDAQHVQFLPDGKTLSFSSRPLNGKASKIYLARLVRKPPTPIETPNASEGPDEANLSAADLLATGEYEWQVVEELPEWIKSFSGADMTADELTLVFSSFRKDGSYGKTDLWMTTRESVESEWLKPVNLGDLINTDDEEVYPALTPDGLTLLFQRGFGGQETWISTRASNTEPWTEPQRFRFAGVVSPDLSGDQRTVVTGFGGLSISRRSSSDAPWPNPTPIGPPVNSDAQEKYGSISEDGRLLLFHRDKDSEGLGFWVATRADWNATWSEPIRISNSWGFPAIATPRLLPDGKSILFTASHDDNGGFARKVYIARLVHKDAQ